MTLRELTLVLFMGLGQFDGWGGDLFQAAAFQSFAEFALLAGIRGLTFKADALAVQFFEFFGELLFFANRLVGVV